MHFARNLRLNFGKKALAEAEFKDLINDFSVRSNILSKETRALANKVRMAGNDVLHHHGTLSTDADALSIIEAAREVI
jgi:hypothetical protein